MATYISRYAKENGLRRVNATKSLVLSVKPDDVKKGAAKDSECCAFARAAMKQDSAITKVFFFKSVAWVETAMKLTRYNLPQSVQKEIVAFDRFRTMEPGVYALSPPAKSAEPEAQAKRDARRDKRHKAGNTGRKQPLRHITTNVREGVKPK